MTAALTTRTLTAIKAEEIQGTVNCGTSEVDGRLWGSLLQGQYEDLTGLVAPACPLQPVSKPKFFPFLLDGENDLRAERDGKGLR